MAALRRSSKASGRPIMALLDVLGRRWALRVLWELRASVLNFRALQAACGDISPTVLNQRLAELREAGLVQWSDAGFALTPLGDELIVAFEPLSRCCARCAGSRRVYRAPVRCSQSCWTTINSALLPLASAMTPRPLMFDVLPWSVAMPKVV